MTEATMASRPTHAMILAAGLGTRMAATVDQPKPLVPLAGKPLIDYAVERFARFGIARVVVNVHFGAERLRAHLARVHKPEIVISDETAALLDTGGGVAQALPSLGPAPFFTHNCDSVLIDGMGDSLERLAQSWDDSAMDALMLLSPTIHAVGYEGLGDFVMDPDGRLARRSETRVSPFAWTGVQLLHPRLFEGCQPGRFSINALWDRAIDQGRLFGLRHDGIWLHVGTPEARRAAEQTLAEL
jgi:MurNAc alpha-1-phosphate uridylyltransferase